MTPEQALEAELNAAERHVAELDRLVTRYRNRIVTLKEELEASERRAQDLDTDAIEWSAAWVAVERRVRAVVATWREELHRETNPQRYTLLDRCAYELDAALGEPEEPVR